MLRNNANVIQRVCPTNVNAKVVNYADNLRYELLSRLLYDRVLYVECIILSLY